MNTARVQSPAPNFVAKAVVNNEIKTISLSNYAGRYVVLFFYPKDFTFVCPTEIIAFSDRSDEFKRLNAEVIAVSCDSENTHLAWVNTPRNKGGLGHVTIPLVADKNHYISEKYGVLIEKEGITLRGLFIIDGKGVIRQITINDLPVGRNVDEVLRLVEAFQFTDEHGEVCPIGWTKGGKTIKPDPKSSQEFFSEFYKE